jgi:hypothetical protein
MIALAAVTAYVIYRGVRPAAARADTSQNTFRDPAFEGALQQTHGIEASFSPELPRAEREALLKQYQLFLLARAKERAADPELAASRLMSSSAVTSSPYAQ